MQIRDLEISDYHLKYCNLIQHAFQKDFKYIQYLDFKNFVNELAKIISFKAIEENGEIVASGTLVIEPKLVHHFGKVGHIEDIFVNLKYQGQGLGQEIVTHLIDLSKQLDEDKCILNCDVNLIKFYQKCGLEPKNMQMVKYFNDLSLKIDM